MRGNCPLASPQAQTCLREKPSSLPSALHNGPTIPALRPGPNDQMCREVLDWTQTQTQQKDTMKEPAEPGQVCRATRRTRADASVQPSCRQWAWRRQASRPPPGGAASTHRGRHCVPAFILPSALHTGNSGPTRQPTGHSTPDLWDAAPTGFSRFLGQPVNELRLQSVSEERKLISFPQSLLRVFNIKVRG